MMIRSAAVIAPHLSFPLRNGADVYIASKWGSLDPADCRVWLLASDAVWLSGGDGQWQVVQRWPRNTRRSGSAAAALMLLSGRDYMGAKFNTPAYLRACRAVVQACADLRDVDLVVASFPSAFGLAERMGIRGRLTAVETQNFDPKLYLDRSLEASSVVRRYLSLLAAMRSYQVLRRIPEQVPKIALGSGDTAMFEAFGMRPVLHSELGTEVFPPRTVFPDPSAIRISFVGSLSVSMNDTAVREFVGTTLVDLRRRCQLPLAFHVIGSRPSASLRQFLERHSVPLHADVSNEELDLLLQHSHATVLPFANSNGLKLKFWTSVSRGVPVLSLISAPEALASCSGVLVSRDPSAWSGFLSRLAGDPVHQRAVSAALQALARANSWRTFASAELGRLDTSTTRSAASFPASMLSEVRVC